MLKITTPRRFWYPLFCTLVLSSSYGTLAEVGTGEPDRAPAADPEALTELRCGEYDLQGRLIQGRKDSPYPDSIEVFSGKKLIKVVRIKDLPRLQTQSYRDHFVRVRADIVETQQGTEDAHARVVEFQGSVTERNATREGIRQIRDRPCKN